MDNEYQEFSLLKILPIDEMLNVVGLPVAEKSRLIIAGYANYTLKHFVLIKGDGYSVQAPFDLFKPSGDEEPNFEQLEIVEYGTAIKLGSYLASTRSILIQLDSTYKSDTNIN